MPELPEVETVLQGIKPCLEGSCVEKLVIRQAQLRWPIPLHLERSLVHQVIGTISRRAKYLLIPVQTGTLLIHLGMSGSLRIVTNQTPAQKHDHVDLIFTNGKTLRYTDPRRFGAILWTEEDPKLHPLLKNLGPEPLNTTFSDTYLFKKCVGRKKTIKELIMDNHVVVGIGNIYAAESLFRAQIQPLKPAGTLSIKECTKLVDAIKAILQQAITKGGTTIKDFSSSEGKPGYFAQELQVYGRAKLPCKICQTPLSQAKLGQRSTVFCTKCQN